MCVNLGVFLDFEIKRDFFLNPWVLRNTLSALQQSKRLALLTPLLPLSSLPGHPLPTASVQGRAKRGREVGVQRGRGVPVLAPGDPEQLQPRATAQSAPLSSERRAAPAQASASTTTCPTCGSTGATLAMGARASFFLFCASVLGSPPRICAGKRMGLRVKSIWRSLGWCALANRR